MVLLLLNNTFIIIHYGLQCLTLHLQKHSRPSLFLNLYTHTNVALTSSVRATAVSLYLDDVRMELMKVILYYVLKT